MARRQGPQASDPGNTGPEKGPCEKGLYAGAYVHAVGRQGMPPRDGLTPTTRKFAPKVGRKPFHG